MKILVTGANGFIGSSCCRHLSGLGHEVYAMVRKTSNLKFLNALPVKIVYADITNRESLKGQFDGLDVIVHSAGAVIDWGPYEDFRKHNVEGTQNIALEASSAGVKRLVQISSVAIYGFGVRDANENSPMVNSHVGYCQSKIEMEQWLDAYEQKTTLEVVRVRPGNVFGPGDEKFIGEYLKLIAQGQFVYVGGGRSLTCPSYIENLCHGVTLCCTHPAAKGEGFIITDGLDINWKQFTDPFFASLGLKPQNRSVPFGLVYALAWLMEMVYKLFGIRKAPLLTRYRIDNAGKDYHFSIEKARRLLGYSPVVDFKTSVDRTVQWYLKWKT